MEQQKEKESYELKNELRQQEFTNQGNFQKGGVNFSIKTTPNDLLLHPYIRIFFNPHERNFFLK